MIDEKLDRAFRQSETARRAYMKAFRGSDLNWPTQLMPDTFDPESHIKEAEMMDNAVTRGIPLTQDEIYNAFDMTEEAWRW